MKSWYVIIQHVCSVHHCLRRCSVKLACDGKPLDMAVVCFARKAPENTRHHSDVDRCGNSLLKPRPVISRGKPIECAAAAAACPCCEVAGNLRSALMKLLLVVHQALQANLEPVLQSLSCVLQKMQLLE